MKLISIALLTALCFAHKAQSATGLTPKPQVGREYYLDGAVLTRTEALVASLNGQQILECKPVKAVWSKSGTSLNLKPVKDGAK